MRPHSVLGLALLVSAFGFGCAMEGSFIGDPPTSGEDRDGATDPPIEEEDAGSVTTPSRDTGTPTSPPVDPPHDAGGTDAYTPPPPPPTDAGTPPPPPPPSGKAPELGTGDHTSSSVKLTVIAGPSALLKTPRDLAFNPNRPDELWVVNGGDDSVVIIKDASKETRTTERRRDVAASHFMPKPSALAFGANYTSFGAVGTMGTCPESRNGGDDFMGPTLWSTDLTIFAKKDPYGEGSHLDMLHLSSYCMGIAHQEANVYWTLNGLTNSIVKYDFGIDHGIGRTDHSDGQAWVYVSGKVKYLPGVPSHLVYRAADAMLYIADAGNARVAKLDTKSGVLGSKLSPKEPMKTYARMESATITDVVAASTKLVTAPSGIEIKGDYLYVTDDANGRINAFTFAGERVNWLDTGLPNKSLAGLVFGPDGRVYFVDMVGHRVLRIDPA